MTVVENVHEVFKTAGNVFKKAINAGFRESDNYIIIGPRGPFLDGEH